jgi:two-component system response regulator HydG/two-component system response regulator AtoC
MLPFQPVQQELPSEFIGESDPIRRMRELISRIAPTDSTVLITGETGTGKELVARSIHRLSLRANEPIVCVNCAAIPDTLLESELFGFEKGAFTGAVARQTGKLKQANRGTVFLDEIGDMSALAQSKILRVVEAHEIQPLGAESGTRIDVRFVAATHQDLGDLTAERRFRPDLYFRLNVVPVRVPSLRDRKSDIPLLVDHFLRDLNARYSRDIEGVSISALTLLENYDWPGNVRQLRNVLEGAFILCASRWISRSDLTCLHWLSAQASYPTAMLNIEIASHKASQPDRDRLVNALKTTHWNKSKAARVLHWSRMTIYRKLAKYQIPYTEESPSGEMTSAGV